jgi:CIC family chloride channel protein
MNGGAFFQALLGRDPRHLVGRFVLCVLVGLVAGLGAAGFYYMLELGREVCMDHLAHYTPPVAGYEKPETPPEPVAPPVPLRRWMLLILPAIGGLISGLLVFTLAPEAEGHGTDAAIEAYHFKGGLVRARVPLIKMIASAITIGSGGSGGREGPIAQIGSGFGSVLARLLRLDPHERRILMAAGMGAGIGAIFHAPLAGALFAAEVMYKELDIEHEILVPAFIASIIAYAVFGSIFGFHPLFITPNYDFDQALLLVPFLILGVACAAGAALYVTAFYGVRSLILRRLRIPNHVKPALGGLLVGVIGFFLPEALGTGYGVVQACFHGPGLPPHTQITQLTSWQPLTALLPTASANTLAILLLAAIGLAKIATTSLSIGSGGSGGVFGPAVVIGGALGGATGILCQRLFPLLPVQPGAFALVGMAGFFAGAANTPISTIIMISEMTGNYNLLVPSMLVCILAYVLCRRFNLYQKQLPSRFQAPSQIANMASAVLRQLGVAQSLAKRPDEATVVVPRNLELRSLMRHFARSSQACLPVVDSQQRLTGMIDTRDLRRIIGETGLDDLVLAQDIEMPATTVTRADSLLTAMRRMIVSHNDELVVVDEHDPRKVIGTLSRADIVAAYDRSMISGAAQHAADL